jgi:redox-sensitive bicupin YhaK (pirin superfamily)
MSDAAFKTARYPAYSNTELETFIASGRDEFGYMADELGRRKRVAAGDMSSMTAGERLRYSRAHS